MASNPKTIYTPDEYLALERSCETKHEYYDGEIFAMGGASRYHVLIVTNSVVALRLAVERGALPGLFGGLARQSFADRALHLSRCHCPLRRASI